MNAAATERHALDILEADVRLVRDAMLSADTARAADIVTTHPAHRRSAANLVHYLELRRHDQRDLQARLAAAGSSSLGRSEAHVLATTEEVLPVLARLNGHEPPYARPESRSPTNEPFHHRRLGVELLARTGMRVGEL